MYFSFHFCVLNLVYPISPKLRFHNHYLILLRDFSDYWMYYIVNNFPWFILFSIFISQDAFLENVIPNYLQEYIPFVASSKLLKSRPSQASIPPFVLFLVQLFKHTYNILSSYLHFSHNNLMIRIWRLNTLSVPRTLPLTNSMFHHIHPFFFFI